MSQTKDRLFSGLFAYLGFLIAWGIGQATANLAGETSRFLSLVFFMVVYIAIFGIATPLSLSRKFGYPLHAPVSKPRLIAGLTVFLFVFVIGVFFSDALPKLQAHPPSAEGLIKYFLLFPPMALGICFQSFFLIPKTIEAVMDQKMSTTWIAVLAVMASVISIGIGFWVDQLFSSFGTAIVMMVLGLFFGLGAILTRSLYLTYAFFLPTMLVNTLSEGKYFGFPWSALIIGFLCSFVIVLHHIRKSR